MPSEAGTVYLSAQTDYDDETIGCWAWEDFEEDWSDDLTMVRKIFDGELSSMQIVEWFFKQPLSQSI